MIGIDLQSRWQLNSDESCIKEFTAVVYAAAIFGGKTSIQYCEFSVVRIQHRKMEMAACPIACWLCFQSHSLMYNLTILTLTDDLSNSVDPNQRGPVGAF